MVGDRVSISSSNRSSPISPGQINGPRDKDGTPAFVMNLDAGDLQKLSKSPISYFDDTKNRLEQLLERVNDKSLKPNSLEAIELKYATPNVAKDYSGPIALLIPEVHMYGEMMKSDDGRSHLGKGKVINLFKGNLHLLQALIESGLSTDFVTEGAMEYKSNNPEFATEDALQYGVLATAIAGMMNVNVTPGETADSHLKPLAKMVLQFSLSREMKKTSWNPGEISTDSINFGIENMMRNMFVIMNQRLKLNEADAKKTVIKYLKEVIKEFDINEYIKLNEAKIYQFDPSGIEVTEKFLKLGQQKATGLMNWLFFECGHVTALERDRERKTTIAQHANNKLVTTIAGANHLNNLVVNELEASGIPVMIVSAELYFPQLKEQGFSFDFTNSKTRSEAEQSAFTAKNNSKNARIMFRGY